MSRARRHLTGRLRHALAALTSVVIGCGCSGDHPNAWHATPDAKRTEALRRFSGATNDINGLVRVHAGGGACTGQLLTRRWVLTTAHCICASDLTPDGGASSIRISVGEESAGADFVARHPTLDAALVRLDHMFPLGRPVSLFGGDASSLAGTVVTVRGFTPDAGGVTAQFHVDAAGAAIASVTSTCPGGASSLTVDGFTLGPSIESGNFDVSDAGAPCYYADALAGIVASRGADDSRAVVVGIDSLRQWIHDTTDIWSDAECAGDVPNTKFAVDPAVFRGPGTGNALMLIAQHAYGVPHDQRIMLSQSDEPRTKTSFVSLPGPNEVDDVLAIGGSSGDYGYGDGTAGQYATAWYLDGQHQQRALLWYEPANDRWLSALKSPTHPVETPYAGTGDVVSEQFVRGGMDFSESISLWVANDGVAGITYYLGKTPSFDLHNDFVDALMPADAPVADASRKPSVVFRPARGTILAGYRSLAGQYVTYAGNKNCWRSANGFSWWCGPTPQANGNGTLNRGQVTAYDLPMDAIRDVGLGVTDPDDTNWAVSVGNDDQLRLWRLTDGGGVRDYGAIGDRALGNVKTVPWEVKPGWQSLMVAYTGTSWSARLRPVDNCLANTPPGW